VLSFRIGKASPKTPLSSKSFWESQARQIGGVRSSGVQEFRSSGVQEFRSSGVQEFRSSGVQRRGNLEIASVKGSNPRIWRRSIAHHCRLLNS
jgi:hypothetical protein